MVAVTRAKRGFTLAIESIASVNRGAKEWPRLDASVPVAVRLLSDILPFLLSANRKGCRNRQPFSFFIL